MQKLQVASGGIFFYNIQKLLLIPFILGKTSSNPDAGNIGHEKVITLMTTTNRLRCQFAVQQDQSQHY
jgi:hypothetical protein